MSSINEVDELIKQLNMNISMYKKPEYRITETSITGVKNKYIINNLEAELEDGVLYFGDLKEIILTEDYALAGFLIASVKDIIFNDSNIDIIFEHNSILIELL